MAATPIHGFDSTLAFQAKLHDLERSDVAIREHFSEIVTIFNRVWNPQFSVSQFGNEILEENLSLTLKTRSIVEILQIASDVSCQAQIALLNLEEVCQPQVAIKRAFEKKLYDLWQTDETIRESFSEIVRIFNECLARPGFSGAFRRTMVDKNSILKLSESTFSTVLKRAEDVMSQAKKAFPGVYEPCPARPCTRSIEIKEIPQSVRTIAEKLHISDIARLYHYVQTDILEALNGDEQELDRLLLIIQEDLKGKLQNLFGVFSTGIKYVTVYFGPKVTQKSLVIQGLLQVSFSPTLGARKVSLKGTGITMMNISETVWDFLRRTDVPITSTEELDELHDRPFWLYDVETEDWPPVRLVIPGNS
jgi:hypothetical protein